MLKTLVTFFQNIFMVSWDDVFDAEHPNETFDTFHNKFSKIFQQHFPIRCIKVKKRADGNAH